MQSHPVFLFLPFRLDATNEQVSRGSRGLALRPKTYEVLLYLVRNPQRLVTKQELLENVWADTVVSDELLRGYIRELREALGDNAKKPRYIETVQARGYRLPLHVELEVPPSPTSADKRVQTLENKPAKVHRAMRVGILHSLTGTMAWTESPVVDATLLAIEEINERGGIRGHEIQPVVIDGESQETAFARHAD
jgi:DNA-binding winged helix-turn-helix (wHTH) protein